MTRKVLNLYAGIGGNRKLWEDVEVTAIEIKADIAAIYEDLFPNDKIVVGDAHQYLLEHFEDFDFIWSSPPCPSHSQIRKISHDQNKPIYPDMQLYEEILFLEGYCKSPWVVENVIGWYEPLIKPKQIFRHYFWSNFVIPENNHFKRDKIIKEIGRNNNNTNYGFNLSKYKTKGRKDQILRNVVNPELSRYIFDCAFNKKQVGLESFAM